MSRRRKQRAQAKVRTGSAPRAAQGSLEISMIGVVGEHPFTAAEIGEQLKAATDETKEIHVKLSTEGGSVTDGFTIYNMLLAEKTAGRIVAIDVIGAAMSAGSYILMAADKSRIARNGVVMIHEAWSGVQGRAEDFDRTAGELRRINDEMVTVLAQRSGKDPDEIRAMVKAETYLTAQQAIDLGLVDEMMAEPASAKALARFKAAALKGAPAEFLAAVAAATDNQETKNQMNLEELLAAIAALSEEEKAKVLEMLQGEAPAAEDTDEEEESEASKALAAIRELLGDKKVAANAAASDVVTALKAELGKLSKDVNDLVQSNDERDLELCLSANAKRVSPAAAVAFRKQFKAKAASLAGIKEIVASLPEIVGNAPKQHRADAGGAGALKHNGKTWAELKPAERASLKKADPELHAAMRQEAGLK